MDLFKYKPVRLGIILLASIYFQISMGWGKIPLQSIYIKKDEITLYKDVSKMFPKGTIERGSKVYSDLYLYGPDNDMLLIKYNDKTYFIKAIYASKRKVYPLKVKNPLDNLTNHLPSYNNNFVVSYQYAFNLLTTENYQFLDLGYFKNYFRYFSIGAYISPFNSNYQENKISGLAVGVQGAYEYFNILSEQYRFLISSRYTYFPVYSESSNRPFGFSLTHDFFWALSNFASIKTSLGLLVINYQSTPSSSNIIASIGGHINI